MSLSKDLGELSKELDETESVILRAAIRLERQTRLDVLDHLSPYLRHKNACARTPCSCGLDETVRALKEAVAVQS